MKLKIKQALHDITGRSNTLQYIKLHYSIEAPNKYLSWPILWLLILAMSHPRKLVSVLYKKRKFAHKEHTDKERFKDWSPLYEGVGQLRYSIEPPNKYLYCTVLFRTLLYKN